MAADLACDKFWANKSLYHDAEKKYYENLAKLQRNGQKILEELRGDQEETNDNNKVKENKNSYLKNLKISSKQPNIDSLRKESSNLEANNLKIENHNKCVSNDANFFGITKRKGKCDFDKNNEMKNSGKNMKPKETKEKKCRNEKKSKKVKDKEDNAMGSVGMGKVKQDTFPKTSLAGEVAKARQQIKSSLECMNQNLNGVAGITDSGLAAILEKIQTSIERLTKRVEALEQRDASCMHSAQRMVCPSKPQNAEPKTVGSAKPSKDDDDDDVDLFGSESEEEDEEAKKIREQRLAEYAAKKSKKPAVVAKSNIILDIKPWDDETNMKEMEKAVRAIEMDGLVWGASKLVPVAFKIFKLQISCVIEDDKVSVDLLTETLEEIEDYIQSVDIVAFNKV